MAWTPVLLSLLAHCTGHWILGVWGRGPSGTQGSVLYPWSPDGAAGPSPTIPVSFFPFCRVLGTIRADPGGLRVTVSGSVGHPHLHWEQQQRWILWCGLVPTPPGAAPRTVVLGSSRPSGPPARLSGSRSGSTASLSISGLQAEDEADYYCSSWAHSLSAPAVPRAVGKSDKNLPLADGSL